ncbi:MAG TPA: tyrosine-type recombinase/integrase [Acidimicrobiia bacterium]|nr:tyrosine-type recombinase/integrase [Acidimicrobiia bacterium]
MRAASTVRAYAADWSAFTTWCDERRLASLPATAGTVARHLDDVARSHTVATVRRRLAAVRAAHLDAGEPSPTGDAPVRLAVARAEWRQRGAARATVPLGVEELRAMSRALPDSLAGTRDRALLLLGYGAGLRPGELAGLATDDVRRVAKGLRVRIARGTVVVPPGSAVELCAVRAWTRWRRAAGLRGGAAFRGVDRHGRLGDAGLSPKAVTRIVRRSAGAAGLDPTPYAGRSLRRGMVAAAAAQGASDAGIMEHTGHRSRRLVRRYMQDG